MLSKQDSSSSNSSVSDYDFGFGEILEYHEDSDFSYDNFTFTDPFTTSASFDSCHDVHSMHAASFDGPGKGKGKSRMDYQHSHQSHPHDEQFLDQYHPENGKREVVDLVERKMSNSGEIKVSELMHSSEQWSNYYDLCENVKLELRRNGYAAATVECVASGQERHIVYKLS